MQKKLYWKAHSNEDRNRVIDFVKATIASHDAYIMNFNMFSDLAISFSVGIEEHHISQFYNALSNNLKLSDANLTEINSESQKECLLLINISFSRGKGDLKKEIPAVPG